MSEKEDRPSSASGQDAGGREADAVSLIVHDIRSPLTVLRGYLEILGRSPDDLQRVRALEAAKDAVARVDELLDDLVSATTGADVLGPRVLERVRLAQLVREVSATFAGVTDRDFAVSVSEGATVLGDPSRIRQALENLISNAISFSDPGTRVLVSVENSAGRVLLAVDDEGVGIPEDRQEEVFLRGTRLAPDPCQPGSGLGLYIVREIAEGHGGSARAERAPWGRGTRLIIDLPEARALPD